MYIAKTRQPLHPPCLIVFSSGSLDRKGQSCGLGGSDQAGQKSSLILVFTGLTHHIVGFIMTQLIDIYTYPLSFVKLFSIYKSTSADFKN